MIASWSVVSSVLILSAVPLIVLWYTGRKLGLWMKGVLAIVVVLCNLALLCFAAKTFGLAYGRGFYRRNLTRYSELLETSGDREALEYTLFLKRQPMVPLERGGKEK